MKNLNISINKQIAVLQSNKERNAKLQQQIQYLKEQPLAVEAEARNALGMIKRSETYYQILEKKEIKE